MVRVLAYFGMEHDCVRFEVEVHPTTILFGIEQRNDLRTVKYLWPFLFLLRLGVL
jgi:hypothetical protein